MKKMGHFLGLFLILLSSTSAMVAASMMRPVSVPFNKSYVASWGADHIKQLNGGRNVELLLNKEHGGAGFETKDKYLFGHFSMRMKLIPGDSAGTVTTFYLSSMTAEHDELDFEFLGNRSGEPYILHTNVFTGGKGYREQRINLWFDPTKDYHSYSILWNMHQIVFFVDSVPIRVFKNSKDLGVRFPFDQPMRAYSSLWTAENWATRGGLEKTDWTKAPFIASYTDFHVDGCDASTSYSVCATQGLRWWDQEKFRDLNGQQWRLLKWVRKHYTVYNYCTDTTRNQKMPPECARNRDNR